MKIILSGLANTRNCSSPANIIPLVKHGGGSNTPCFALAETGRPVRVEGRMTGTRVYYVNHVFEQHFILVSFTAWSTLQCIYQMNAGRAAVIRSVWGGRL